MMSLTDLPSLYALFNADRMPLSVSLLVVAIASSFAWLGKFGTRGPGCHALPNM